MIELISLTKYKFFNSLIKDFILKLIIYQKLIINESNKSPTNNLLMCFNPIKQYKILSWLHFIYKKQITMFQV